MSDKYTIGVDFGTLSGRALLVRVSDGHEMADAVMDYPHGVIDKYLPETGEELPPDWALEDPHDFPLVLEHVIPEVIARAGVDKKDIIGVGIDFTCCSILPVYKDGTPLCFTDKYKGNKHAYLKLWKHHGAKAYAERMTKIASARGEKWLSAFGGKVSREWMFPKIWQLYDEAPEIYNDCDYILEAGDWMTWMLTGVPTRGYLYAAYKSHYMFFDGGYPSPDFFEALDPGLRNVVNDKLNAPVMMPGKCVGRVTPEAAKRFGLEAGTAVGTASPDAHVAAPAVGFEKCGDMYGVLGTSNCYYALGHEFVNVPGICGCAWDGLAEGLYGFEAGLCCGGDHFAWLADNFTPAEYRAEAERLGVPPIKYIISKAAEKKPGESGLVALDWWNGNRSILVNSFAYYELNENILSDFQYDANAIQLSELKRDHPEEFKRSKYYDYFYDYCQDSDVHYTSGFDLIERVRKDDEDLYRRIWMDAAWALDLKNRGMGMDSDGRTETD